MAFPHPVQVVRDAGHLGDRDRHSLLASGSGSPYAQAVIATLRARLADLRGEYEGQAASEFTRGRIQEIRRVIETLSTGVTHE
jgi:hypothetical protein